MQGCSYKGTEVSPKGFGKCAHLLPAGTQMEGTDGNMWEIRPDKNGRKAWRRMQTKKSPVPKKKKSPVARKKKSPVKAKKSVKSVKGYKIVEKDRAIFLSPTIHSAAWKKIKQCVKDYAFDLE